MYLAIMRVLLAVAGVLAAVVGCRGQRSAASTTAVTQAERTVFTDSVLHSQVCEPLKPGEDWRKVCVPIDQSVRPVPKRP